MVDGLGSGDDAGGEPVAWSVSLLNAIGEGVCLVTWSGELVWANDIVRSWGAPFLSRASEAARMAASHHESAGPDAARLPMPLVSQVSVEGREFELTTSLVRVSGIGGEARRLCIAVAARDVTASWQFRRLIDAIDRAGAELVNLDADNIRKLNAHERLKFLEQKIVRFARDLLRFDHFAIRLLDERSGKLELVMGYGITPEYDVFDIFARPTGCGISGHVAATGRSYICRDVSRDELFLPGVTGAKSSLTVPLKLQDKVIGIMNVESVQPAAFGAEDLQLAEIFARYVAIAVHTLDLLVVERSTTNQTVSGRVAGQLDEPLRDIMLVVDALARQAMGDASATSAVQRIRMDVQSIRERVSECAAGPATLLGVERALADKSADPLLKGKRVLVADDEARIRQIIGEVLRHRGCEVVVCETGAGAIEQIEAGAREGRRFDLIVSDIRMPDRNGYEVFAASRRSTGGVPVILMTGFGYDPHHSIVRASQEGLQAVLFKPFEVEKLLIEVRQALSSPKGGS